MKSDRRGSWYLLTGVVLGVALGLVYSWLISPVRYVDATPYSLRSDYKDQYRTLVAIAYLYSHDLLRAEGRLAQLKDSNPGQTLAQQSQRALAAGHPEEEIRALGMLAIALSGQTTPESSGVPPVTPEIPISTVSESTPTP